MKQMFQKTKSIKLIGVLVKENDEFCVRVQEKDEEFLIPLAEVLEDMLETEIQLQSCEELM